MNRLLLNKVVMLLSTLAALAGLGFLFWILITLGIKGVESIDWHLFTHDLVNKGLRNVIVGQFVLAGIATLIGVPLGMLAGIYLREYGINSRFAMFIRNLSDVMMSAPSIVIGVFIYGLFVAPFGGFNGWAGSIALSIMMIPIIVSTTDSMLSLVPTELREAGIALGASKAQVIMQIVLVAAKIGLITGILLAFARVVGETAPLLFTSANNDYFTLNMSDQFPSLTVSIYQLATFPDAVSQNLAWAGSVILTLMVLFINLTTRFIFRKRKVK
ncbi:MAG TPA: phosphate ABC transporter permease PstA [Campylobacteraceae bacterium]|jgi:phosphate transport system permease protein|nr:phosphate ABC transporter permease PstA [Campylobacteraceae bacterium]HHD84120.1 phosphate ABC transporter permease PstA [Campylobacteraceae bacterium]